MARTGTYTLDDLLKEDTVTITTFGEEAVAAAVLRELDQLNAQVRGEMLTDLAQTTTDRQRTYGVTTGGDFVELDEMGFPAAQKSEGGETVGIPLGKFGRAHAWNRDFMAAATPAFVAKTTREVEAAYLRKIRGTIKNALFGAANYSVVDKFVGPNQPKITLAVKRLLNADGGAIPTGPNGETFDGGTETHYLATDFASATTSEKQAAFEAAIDDLVEHGHGADVRLYINRADQAEVESLPGFKPLSDVRIEYNATDRNVETLDLTRLDNRKIGTLGAASVYTKPWVPASYQFLFAAGDEAPVLFREHTVASMRGLRMAFENESYPLRSEGYEAYLGAGVWNRSNGVVHYSGGAVYQEPPLV